MSHEPTGSIGESRGPVELSERTPAQRKMRERADELQELIRKQTSLMRRMQDISLVKAPMDATDTVLRELQECVMEIETLISNMDMEREEDTAQQPTEA